MRRLMIICATLPALMLMGCAPKVITKEVPIEVRVPVSAPCMGERPAGVISLRDTMTKDEWDALTTDQRENLMGAQALLRKVYGDRITVAAAGCR